MLAVDLRELRHGAVVWEERLAEPGSVWRDVGLRFVGPARLRARAELSPADGVRLTGRLEGSIALQCRRCLAELERPLAVPLDLWFRPAPKGTGADEAGYRFDPHARRLELAPVLREELVLAAPQYPVCRPECAGLCPSCGARRDDQGCDCSFEEPDPRWDELRARR
ncbi:MAG: DUF177 domain-containing protein [Gemmatimonadota bacterium]